MVEQNFGANFCGPSAIFFTKTSLVTLAMLQHNFLRTNNF
jgi:hypothetical protein